MTLSNASSISGLDKTDPITASDEKGSSGRSALLKISAFKADSYLKQKDLEIEVFKIYFFPNWCRIVLFAIGYIGLLFMFGY